MMTSSDGNIFRGTGLCEGNHRSPVDSPHKGLWRGALVYSLISAWTNGWANNRDTCDLRCHHSHYGAIVMTYGSVKRGTRVNQSRPRDTHACSILKHYLLTGPMGAIFGKSHRPINNCNINTTKTKHKNCAFLRDMLQGWFLCPTNQRRRYFVTTSLIGSVQA